MSTNLKWNGNESEGWESDDWRFSIIPDDDLCELFSVKDCITEEWILVGADRKQCFDTCEAIHQREIRGGV